jgi:hypothetical protein
MNSWRVKKAESSLRKVIKLAVIRYSSDKEPFREAFIIIGGRILLDSIGIRLLVKRGYYGPATSLLATSLRSRNMIAALHIREDLVNEFNNEEKWTNSDDKIFQGKFSETNLKKIISEHFSEDYQKKNPFKEIEQILHGSSFAIKRWYCNIIKIDGLRTPTLTLGPFFSKAHEDGLLSNIEGIDTELIGIYYEHYKKEKYLPNLICSCGSGKKYITCCGAK